MTPPARFVIVGFGSIGRRHARNLRTLVPDAEIIAVRRSKSKLNDSLADGIDRVETDLDKVLSLELTAAIVATPATRHVEIATSFARQRVAVLVEKPISDQSHGVSELIRVSKETRVPLMVAYPLRFDWTVATLRRTIASGALGRPIWVHMDAGQYLPDWRPGVDYRSSVSSQKSLGGGALLELSHELDYLMWIFGDVREVTARSYTLGDLEIDVEDCVDILLSLDRRVRAHVHLDMLQRSHTRTCKVVCSGGTIECDLVEGHVRQFGPGEKTWRDTWGSQDNNKMYVSLLHHFLQCLRNGRRPLTTGEEGLRVLQVIEAARESSLQGRTITL